MNTKFKKYFKLSLGNSICDAVTGARVSWGRVELPTFSLGVRCSIHLSYQDNGYILPHMCENSRPPRLAGCSIHLTLRNTQDVEYSGYRVKSRGAGN